MTAKRCWCSTTWPGTPEQQYKRLRSSGMNMSGGSMGSMKDGDGSMGSTGGRMGSSGMRGVHKTPNGRSPGPDHLPQLANLMERGKVDPGDIRYPLYLINGRPPEDQIQVKVLRGERMRLRVVNASADTTFCFFVEGHPLTVTHTDGQPVEYQWTIGGQAFPDADAIRASRGEPQRFVMRNMTMMPHPMHLHGHSFRPVEGGPLKDTLLVLPRREVAVEWVADNPGTWAFHCHNVYHQRLG